MKYKYVGEAEKVFPHLGLTVKPGDEFDAPAGFVATDVIAVDAKPNSSTKPKADVEVKETETTEPSAASDTTLGE
jgi:hypothetical protein